MTLEFYRPASDSKGLFSGKRYNGLFKSNSLLSSSSIPAFLHSCFVRLMVHSADVQDRDGAPDLLKSIRYRWPWLLHVFADGGYAGDKLKRRLKKIGRWTIEIIKRSDKATGFEVLPRRWVVERTFAWLGRG